jgi:hypothetical protein
MPQRHHPRRRQPALALEGPEQAGRGRQAGDRPASTVHDAPDEPASQPAGDRMVEVVPAPVGQIPTAAGRQQPLHAPPFGAEHIAQLLHPSPDGLHGPVGGRHGRPRVRGLPGHGYPEVVVDARTRGQRPRCEVHGAVLSQAACRHCPLHELAWREPGRDGHLGQGRRDALGEPVVPSADLQLLQRGDGLHIADLTE